MATAKYPDGSAPEVIDVVRSATFLFAYRRPPQKLLSASLRMDAPAKSQVRLAKKHSELGGVDVPGGTTLMVYPGQGLVL